MIVIGKHSILGQLPSELNRKQAVFLDGIRHAAEMVDLSYTRLVQILTHIADSRTSQEQMMPRAFTAAYLDAWAIVDSIDRIRSLIHLLPGHTLLPPTDDNPGFRVKTQTIRDLRNVADHLAQRVDNVIAKKSSALGFLSWFTFNEAKDGGYMCTILPGTAAVGQKSISVNPSGKTLTPPTDLITLAAGEYEACLSDAVRETAKVIAALEKAVQQAIDENGLTGSRAGSDFLLTIAIIFGTPDSSGTEIE
jgi:hypothetical protein